MPNIAALITVAAVMFAVLGAITLIAHIYNLNNIKSKTVGDGQHGTARWANKAEIRKTYRHIPFTPKKWRRQAKQNQIPTMTATAPRKLLGKKTEPTEESLPQGIVVGCKGGKHSTTAMIDTGDVHVLMIGAAGVGKTAFWLYPCIEYACASGMSFLSTDTKGDVMRNYGNIAKDYGYMVSVIDLRNPTRSNGNNILYLVNKYTDLYAMLGGITELLNEVIADPESIQIPKSDYEESQEIKRLNAEISKELNTVGFDKEAIKQKMLTCVSEKYMSLGTEEVTAQSLKDIFKDTPPLTAYDSDLTDQAVSGIQLKENGTISLVLINGQRIGKEKSA